MAHQAMTTSVRDQFESDIKPVIIIVDPLRSSQSTKVQYLRKLSLVSKRFYF